MPPGSDASRGFSADGEITATLRDGPPTTGHSADESLCPEPRQTLRKARKKQAAGALAGRAHPLVGEMGSAPAPTRLALSVILTHPPPTCSPPKPALHSVGPQAAGGNQPRIPPATPALSCLPFCTSVGQDRHFVSQELGPTLPPGPLQTGRTVTRR